MMKPEEFSQKCEAALGNRLKAVVLYGSAVTGDFIEKKSGYNMLVVAEAWTPEVMNSFRKLAQNWMRADNPMPLFFTPARLKNSADVFPMEMLDILEAHRVLHGQDPLQGVEVNPQHLRHQVEFELRSKLMALRQGYVGLRKPSKELPGLMTHSIGSVLVVFRGALRLFQQEVPQDKQDALQQLARKLAFPTEVFEEILALKSGEKKWETDRGEDLFLRYLAKIELVLDRVDEELNG